MATATVVIATAVLFLFALSESVRYILALSQLYSVSPPRDRVSAVQFPIATIVFTTLRRALYEALRKVGCLLLLQCASFRMCF